MDGQQPYYNQNNWHSNDQDNDDIFLTHSQTQTIIQNLVESPPPFIDDPAVAVDNGSFMDHGTDTYNEFPHHQLTDQAYHPNSDCVMLEEQSHIPVNTNSSFMSVSEIPAMELWPGHLNFAVEFSKAQDKTKATPWIFSTKLKKLFVSMDKACPISFKMDNLPQEFHRYFIRGQMVYSKADHFHDHVERCPTHRVMGLQSPHAPHVLRCEDTNSTYFEHSDKRHSVVVPLKPPAPGTQSVSLCYKFMCLSSCQGGLNRRPTKLIFTLETLDQVVGRYACDVRICSCPGRDIRAEEGKAEKNHTTEQTAKESEAPELIPIELPPIALQKGKMKKRKATPAAPPIPPPTEPSGDQEDDDGIYNFNIDIPGRRNYLFIRDFVTRFLNDYASRPADSNKHSDHNDTFKRFKKEQP
ncbi:cellular tumor antigen p53-like isoform X2 [Daphnia carinata]|uniref:cellular tumor antigen p53-like isoform X2 n=1 Tax=Daphnia carinata TaxID=120202 RepID=UPI00257A9F17|nr:cellular tumor antigen p53-like isoform X2 [Daphnia carinata]